MNLSDCKIHRLVADVALMAEGKVLLVRYKDVSKYDNQRGWFLPDDFLNHLESPDDAAKRILKEQIDLSAPKVRLSHVESFGDGIWHLIFHYKATMEKIPDVSGSQNVQAMEWFALNKLPNRAEVAHHGWAIDVLDDILREQA